MVVVCFPHPRGLQNMNDNLFLIKHNTFSESCSESASSKSKLKLRNLFRFKKPIETIREVFMECTLRENENAFKDMLMFVLPWLEVPRIEIVRFWIFLYSFIVF